MPKPTPLPPIGLASAAFQSVFPFHLAFNRKLELLQCGHALTKLLGNQVPGGHLDALFVLHPDEPIDFDALVSSPGRLIVLEHVSRGLKLRGQIMHLAETGRGVFIGSPWLRSFDEMTQLGLTFSDFPPHDPVADLLTLVQAQTSGANEAKQLAAHISAQRIELNEARERAEAAERQLLEAIESLDDGFVLYGPDDRLVLCNRRYREIYSASAHVIRPGVSFEEVIRDGATTGQYPAANGRVEEWVAERMAAHRSANSSIEQLHQNGRWLRIDERRTADGSTVGFRVDITKLKQATERAESAAFDAARLSRELNTILELSPDGVIAFDADGKRAYSNQSFHDLTAITPIAARGMRFEAMQAALDDLCDPALPKPSIDRPGQRGTVRIHLVKPRPLILECAVRTMRGKGGRIQERVVYLRDVTHEVEVERMKSEFLSTAAHELRTPMASIYGFTELLLSREFDEDTQRDVLETILRSSKLLVNMVNELLDLARIEARAGRDFQISTQALLPVVQQATRSIVVAGDARKILATLPEHSLMVEMDAEKFGQALGNVLSNAYKYSAGRGEIRLEIVQREKAGARQVGVQVTDEGIGMTPDQVARAFERFYRANPGSTIPGTGLGLSLVKEIMEIQRGEVTLESELGKGTTVTLWLIGAAQPDGYGGPVPAAKAVRARKRAAPRKRDARK